MRMHTPVVANNLDRSCVAALSREFVSFRWRTLAAYADPLNAWGSDPVKTYPDDELWKRLEAPSLPHRLQRARVASWCRLAAAPVSETGKASELRPLGTHGGGVRVYA